MNIPAPPRPLPPPVEVLDEVDPWDDAGLGGCGGVAPFNLESTT